MSEDYATTIHRGTLSPNLKLALVRRGEIWLLLQNTSTDLAVPGVRSILKNGETLGEYLCN